MYDLVYLPIAKKDIEKIISYITENFHSPNVALKLLDSFEKSIFHVKDFPYSHEIYKLSNYLERDYRYVPVKNYIIFYTILEDKKIVEIQRVLYGKINMLENLV